ncbi:MBL fold metallo-hydrolase [Pseudoalteromonas aurantia]|uniref:Metallo-beta-lactamase domain-containing protein n=1 Tax=Pseudoalteromonas aurantia 208 TaxID=1314867 RepID=A0ABR9E6N7_9GAMM|nr:MBL fold metallo-hydrolase [Pseudoalteromonas aurantia]MBE0366655.1 hypothetical protein [Pseudoalteromonas aurantia 208]
MLARLKYVAISTFVAGLTACQTLPIKTIDNPNFNKNSLGKFSNQYPSPFNGHGPHHPYDNIEFLERHEIEKVEPNFINIGSFTGLRKDTGFNYQDLVYPTPRIDETARQTLTWLGHASFLVQQRHTDAFLTDPVFGEFDGFVGWLARRINDDMARQGPAPIKTAQLQFVDGVVISHNHYDHLSEQTLNQLATDTQLLLPLAVTDNVDYKQGPITEMDWYTQTSVGNTDIHFLPAHHFSRRGLTDWNKTLWGSWLFDDGEHTVFFAGDTGYSQIYKDIKAQFNGFDVCLMPIVAYDHNYRSIHLAPEDAVKAAQDLACKVFIPWGYGTWLLGYEHVNEPLRRLKKAFKDINPNMHLKIMQIGESIRYTDLLPPPNVKTNVEQIAD